MWATPAMLTWVWGLRARAMQLSTRLGTGGWGMEPPAPHPPAYCLRSGVGLHMAGGLHTCTHPAPHSWHSQSHGALSRSLCLQLLGRLSGVRWGAETLAAWIGPSPPRPKLTSWGGGPYYFPPLPSSPLPLTAGGSGAAETERNCAGPVSGGQGKPPP